MFQDEGRFGIMTTIGRQWVEKGKDFVIKTKQGRENMYSYAAVSPENGSMVIESYEKANTDAMQAFLKKVDHEMKHAPILMIMDRAAWHTTQKLSIPKDILLLFLPPTSPQLNLVEYLWKHIRSEKFHNVIFNTLADTYAAMKEVVSELVPEKLKTLCACSYL